MGRTTRLFRVARVTSLAHVYGMTACHVLLWLRGRTAARRLLPTALAFAHLAQEFRKPQGSPFANEATFLLDHKTLAGGKASDDTFSRSIKPDFVPLRQRRLRRVSHRCVDRFGSLSPSILLYGTDSTCIRKPVLCHGGTRRTS